MNCTADQCVQGRIACTRTECGYRDSNEICDDEFHYERVAARLDAARKYAPYVALFAVVCVALAAAWAWSPL